MFGQVFLESLVYLFCNWIQVEIFLASRLDLFFQLFSRVEHTVQQLTGNTTSNLFDFLVFIWNTITIKVFRGLQKFVLSNINDFFDPVVWMLEFIQQIIELFLLSAELVLSKLILCKILLVVEQLLKVCVIFFLLSCLVRVCFCLIM